MKSLKKLLISAMIVFGFAFFNANANAACGKISIANMNWASANLMAEVDKVILEKGYGCTVELIPGATMPTFTSNTNDLIPEPIFLDKIEDVMRGIDSTVPTTSLIE